jgi:hypothetical protein
MLTYTRAVRNQRRSTSSPTRPRNATRFPSPTPHVAGDNVGRSTERAAIAAQPKPTPQVIVRTITKTVRVPVVRTITKTVTVLVTVVAQPTATPVPSAPQTLLDVQGSDNKQTDTFVANGPFTIGWKADPNADAGAGGTVLFSVELNDAQGQLLELIANSSSATQDTSTIHDDCSAGCYLKISSLGADWHVVAVQ